MRMVEALEGKGLHMALTRGEAKLGDHLRGLTQQVIVKIEGFSYSFYSYYCVEN